jgi:hypothetical protein
MSCFINPINIKPIKHLKFDILLEMFVKRLEVTGIWNNSQFDYDEKRIIEAGVIERNKLVQSADKVIYN